MPPEQQQVNLATPGWVLVVFGIAVSAGVLGSLGLLLRQRWAVPLFLLSLLAVVVQTIGAYLTTPAWELMGASHLVMPVIVTLVAAFLWWYAGRARAKGWLG